jgi:hypothetical protein
MLSPGSGLKRRDRGAIGRLHRLSNKLRKKDAIPRRVSTNSSNIMILSYEIWQRWIDLVIGQAAKAVDFRQHPDRANPTNVRSASNLRLLV